eukprot:2816392-Prymnesium_polylepis.1
MEESEKKTPKGHADESTRDKQTRDKRGQTYVKSGLHRTMVIEVGISGSWAGMVSAAATSRSGRHTRPRPLRRMRL